MGSQKPITTLPNMMRLVLALSSLAAVNAGFTEDVDAELAANNPGATACGTATDTDSIAYCTSLMTLYAADMPSKHPALLDTIPALTSPPNLGQSVLPMVSPANTIHSTTSWKCDSDSSGTASSFPALAGELAYAYVVQGNPTPYCVPLPKDSSGSVSESKWLQLAYAMKKDEQAMWAAYYLTTPITSLADYLAADAFYLWDYAAK